MPSVDINKIMNEMMIPFYGNYSEGAGGFKINFSQSAADDIFASERANRYRFDMTTQIALCIAYAILMAFGASGNGLVCFVVARNPHMRTPRNIFIINLAISDFTLCVFTQPFNLLKLIYKDWFFGEFMCKFVPMFQGTNVFVSTISITAIALDRFQVIVYPTKDSMKKVGSAVALICIWVISLLMASPLLIFNVMEEFPGVYRYNMCIESTSLVFAKGSYSIASMIVQYIVPIIIVSIAHAQICNKLKYRMVNQPRPGNVTTPSNQRRQEREAARKRKTNLLLLMIAVVFALSWLPLNVLNVLLDYKKLDNLKNINWVLLISICHMIVLSSACTNPMLYGWLNDNFKKEFIKVLCCPCCRHLAMLCHCQCQCIEDPNAHPNTVIRYSRTDVNGSSLVVPKEQENVTLVTDQATPMPSPSKLR
ncbi:neuropeptide F receptor-like [Lineus longissimus]|uniref:neuropeptide F receptor-like n=1 Tax=Lineus longissimus TaxID=88925 RepID=UPI00315C6527